MDSSNIVVHPSNGQCFSDPYLPVDGQKKNMKLSSIPLDDPEVIISYPTQPENEAYRKSFSDAEKVSSI